MTRPPFDTDSPGTEHGGADAPLRRVSSHHVLWHSLGLLLALAVAWLVFRAYRQPDFLIDLINMQLC